MKLRPKLAVIVFCALLCCTFPYLAYRMYQDNVMAGRSLLQHGLSEFLEQAEEAKDGKPGPQVTYEDPLLLVDHAQNLSLGGCYSYIYSKPRRGSKKNERVTQRLNGKVSQDGDWIGILVPYRDRAMHLRTFVPTMHAFLRKQFEMRKREAKGNGLSEFSLKYCLIVVEQTFDARFNRGILFNIGYLHARRLFPTYEFNCWIFHDVDLLPEDIRLLYECFPAPRAVDKSTTTILQSRSKTRHKIDRTPNSTENKSNSRFSTHIAADFPSNESEIDKVKHLVVGIDQFNYTLLYSINVGGVLAVREDQFVAANGYSNLYFGYGGEDDDFYQRLRVLNVGIYRQSVEVSRYHALRAAHVQAEPNMIVMALLSKAAERMPTDGLNVYEGDNVHLNQLKFPKVSQPADVGKLVASTQTRLGYTWILVRVCTTSPTFECRSKLAANQNERLNMLHQHGHDFNEHYY